MPVLLASIGANSALLGLIEGLADGAASFAKFASGLYSDRLRRRKPLAVVGYLVTVRYGQSRIGHTMVAGTDRPRRGLVGPGPISHGVARTRLSLVPQEMQIRPVCADFRQTPQRICGIEDCVAERG